MLNPIKYLVKRPWTGIRDELVKDLIVEDGKIVDTLTANLNTIGINIARIHRYLVALDASLNARKKGQIPEFMKKLGNSRRYYWKITRRLDGIQSEKLTVFSKEWFIKIIRDLQTVREKKFASALEVDKTKELFVVNKLISNLGKTRGKFKKIIDYLRQNTERYQGTNRIMPAIRTQQNLTQIENETIILLNATMTSLTQASVYLRNRFNEALEKYEGLKTVTP